MNAWLRRYFAVVGIIAVLSRVAGTQPSRTEMALWTVSLVIVGFAVYRWLGEPSRPRPSPRPPYSSPMSEYLPPSKVRRSW